jgi:hypothetical protein
VQQAAAIGRAVVQGCQQPRFGQAEAEHCHAAFEGNAIAAIGIDDQHLRGTLSVALDEGGQLSGLVRFVEQVAANDQIEAAQRQILGFPVSRAIGHGRQVVEQQVGAQEIRSQWMPIAGGDLSATAMHHHAGQRQTAADFQNPVSTEIPGLHQVGEFLCGRPDQAEESPTCGGYSSGGGAAQWVGVLLVVEQGANRKGHPAGDGDLLERHRIAGHRLSAGVADGPAGCGLRCDGS